MATMTRGGLAACMLVVLAAGTLTLTTQPRPAAAYGRRASTPTAQFVQSICNTTVAERVYQAYCYNVLVDGREGYKGSHVRVVGAAISRMRKNLANNAAEMRRFKATPAGAQYNLEPCIAVCEEAASDGAAPTLAKLGSLEAAGDDRVAQPDLDALTKWVDRFVVGVKRACVRDVIYVDPNSELIEGTSIPTREFLNDDVMTCRDLVRNYNKYTPPPAQQKA